MKKSYSQREFEKNKKELIQSINPQSIPQMKREFILRIKSWKGPDTPELNHFYDHLIELFEKDPIGGLAALKMIDEHHLL